MKKNRSAGKTRMLSQSLTRQVLVLSIIAILGLFAQVIIGLNATLQGAQRRLAGEANSAVVNFTKFISEVQSDLKASSAALPTSTDAEAILRQILDRQPAIFEVWYVDSAGTVLAQRRRVGENPLTKLEQPWLTKVQEGGFYIGPVDYSQYGVPFVDLAVGVTDKESNFAGTLVARTDFTAVWNPVTSTQIGETGYAYITDEEGNILAYRESELVTSGASLPSLINKGPKEITEANPAFYRGIEGKYVIAAGKYIEIAPWYIIVEQPMQEALGTFFALMLAQVLLLGFVAWQVTASIRFTQTRVAAPLAKLRNGVEQLQSGKLDTRIEMPVEDELGNLATTFNSMAVQIQELISSLEQRVIERTTELETAGKLNIEKASRLRTIAEVGRAITSIQDPTRLLYEITRQVSEAFSFYHTGIFLIDSSGQNAILSAANSTGGQKMLARGHRLKVGQTGIVGYVTASGRARIALNVGEDAVFFNNPDLPETRSEIALPLKVGETIIGALDVQSTEPNAFTEDDTETLGILSDQVAIAIQNSRLFEETRKALDEYETIQGQYQQSRWKQFSAQSALIGFRYSTTGVAPLEKPLMTPEIHEAQGGKTIAEGNPGKFASLAVPVKLRDTVLGVVNIRVPEGHEWTQDEIDITQTVADRVALALENARLLNETSRRATKERTISEISAKIGGSVQMENILRTAAEEIGLIIKNTEVLIQIQPALKSDDSPR